MMNKEKKETLIKKADDLSSEALAKDDDPAALISYSGDK